MSQEITVVYRWTAKPGKLDELKAIYQQVRDEMEATEPGTLRMETYFADDELWESVPPLDYEAPDLAWVLGNRTLSLVMLGLWLIGAFVAAVTGARRAEVG